MRNRVTELLGIMHPIALGGMAGVTDAGLAAAVSEAGGLGVIGAAKESGESLREEIARLRSITDKPFAVNIPVMLPHSEEVIGIIIEEMVPVAVTGAGSAARFTETLKQNGRIVIHVAPNVDAARKAERAGVDAIIAEGFESGGVVSPAEIGTLVLVPQVVDAVGVPVLAAGGVADSRGFAACLALGAGGVSVGTAFLAASECTRIGTAWRNQLLKGGDQATRIAGRGVFPVRMLSNTVCEEIDKAAAAGVPPKEIFALVLSGDAMGESDGPFPCGQCAGLVNRIRPAVEIIEEFIEGAERLIRTMAELIAVGSDLRLGI